MKYNALVNPEGKIITDFIYYCTDKTISKFNSKKGNKFFPVSKDGRNYCAINSQGENVVDENIIDVDCRGPLIIAKDERTFRDPDFGLKFLCTYHLYDDDGNRIDDWGYKVVGSFNEGLLPVAKSYDRHNTIGNFQYINEKGEEVAPVKYVEATSFSNGLALVMEGFGKAKIIDTKFNDVFCFSESFNNYFTIFEQFVNGIAKIQKREYHRGMTNPIYEKTGYVDIEGNTILSNKVVEEKSFRCIKTLFGYTCFDKNRKKHKLKYQPIYEYEKYLICFDGNNLYSYDKEQKTYQLLSSEFNKDDEIYFKDNILSYKDKFYFIGDQIIDLGIAGYSSDKILSIKIIFQFYLLMIFLNIIKLIQIIEKNCKMKLIF